jgi:Tfp pilus assembly protein PilF
MIPSHRWLSVGTFLIAFAAPVAAQKPAAKPPEGALPLSGLAEAKLFPDLCLVRYRISTTSPRCQAYFDQGLGYFYSYVWMEAARSFETAAKHDPDCPMAWWGLSRAMERWQKGDHTKAMKKAQELMPKASHREQMLITARLQEKGLMPNIAAEQWKRTAARTLDDLIGLYDDDEEAWYNRAQIAESGAAAVPYYKALLRLNPVHPGANHELVHHYERIQRPALGWIYAEKYIESSPGIPHAFHMQAHLATRLGRWDRTSDRSARAIELERAYHRDANVKPRDDFQYSHHLETLTVSLIHDGRFREAREIKAEAQKHGYRQALVWFKLHLAERDWDECRKIVEQYRKTDKVTASYLAARLALQQGDVDRARSEVEVLQQAYQKGKTDKTLEFRLWETQGQVMCRSDSPEAGLKLLAKAVDRSKNDYAHHAWGNGAYYMEAWGIAALKCGQLEIAEEGLLEALAHDGGSVRAALGMQVLCERTGRTEEAARYAAKARRCWLKADAGCLEAELAALREEERTTEAQRAQR